MPLILNPVRLGDSDLRVVSTIVQKWITRALTDRRRMVDEWREDLRTYEGMPKLKTKNFPWPGASNLEIPIKAIVTDVIAARLHNAIWASENVWTSKTEDPAAVEAARTLESFLSVESRNRLRLQQAALSWEHEAVLLGTGFLKGMWLDSRRYTMVPRSDGSYEPQLIFDHYGPLFDPVPIEDILVPSNARAINGPFRCQWIAHVVRLDEWQLRQRALKPEQGGWGYAPVPDHKEDSRMLEPEIKEQRERILGVEPSFRSGTEVMEIYCNFPIYELDKFPNRKIDMGDGTSITRDHAELVITYHWSSQTVLRVIENPNEIGWRPIFNLKYGHRTASVYGRGVGRMIHSMSQSLNVVHNQRIDNATVANTRIWKARKNAFARGTQITPSKILWMDDPSTDLQPEQLGDVYPSATQNEMILRDYIERRTGVVDYSLGKESDIGRYSATATSVTKLLEEGTRKYDFVLADWHGTYGELALWLLSVYRQYGYHYEPFLVMQFGEQKAQEIMMILEAQSPQPVFSTYKFMLTATSVRDSKTAQQQEAQMLWEMAERFYAQVINLMPMITGGPNPATGIPFSPAERTVALEALDAGVAVFARILHALGVKDTERYLPNVPAIMEAVQNGAPPPIPPGAQAVPQLGPGPGAPGSPEGGAAEGTQAA